MSKSVIIHCFVGLLIRFGFILYGSFQDEYSDVQFTDVDYKVFTDAARHVLNGESPYLRHTYRYSPIVAYLMVLNIICHPVTGKIIFSIFDLLVTLLIYKILRIDGFDMRRSAKFSLVWLYNPLSIVVTTRGNADSIAGLLVILTLFALRKKSYFWSGLFHGFAVHFRLYPIVFSLPLYFSIESKKGPRNQFLKLFYPNKARLLLVSGCILGLSALTGLFYCLYGYEYLFESTLYHVKRTDVRHNYSIYFYLQYLSYDLEQSVALKLLTSFPLLVLLLVLAFSFRSREHLPFCLMCMSFVMVMFNSVLTCQYFIWYLSLFPLCLPKLHCSFKELVLVSNFWFVSQAAWLLPAYLLEFQFMNTFVYIWFQCIVFFWANFVVLSSFIRNYDKKLKAP